MSCVNLLCECMYLSTIVRFVTAKKIGFSRMIVSPAASNCISARREWWWWRYVKYPLFYCEMTSTCIDDAPLMAPIKLYRGAKWARDADYRGAFHRLKQCLTLQRWHRLDKSICFRIRGRGTFFCVGLSQAIYIDCIWGNRKWTQIINIIQAVCQLQLAWR